MNYEGRTRWKGHQDRQLVRIDSFVLKWSTKKVMISICQNRSFLRTGTSFITILIAVSKLKFILQQLPTFSIENGIRSGLHSIENTMTLWVLPGVRITTPNICENFFTLLNEKFGIRRLSMSFKIMKKWIESNWFELKPNLSQTRSSRLFIRKWRIEKTRFD